MGLDVTARTSIAADRNAIWDYASDPVNDPIWISGIRTATWLTEPPLREGTRVERVATFLGRRIEYVLEVVECRPGSRLRMKSVRAPFPMEITYEFEDRAGAVDASVRVQGGPTGLVAPMGSLMAPMVRRSVTADLGNLRARFEPS
jgi:Polyketide cyclase / dehydrase and lipid transport